MILENTASSITRYPISLSARFVSNARKPWLLEWVDFFVGAVCEFVSPKEQVWIMFPILCILFAYFQVTFAYASNRLIHISSYNNVYENGLVFRSNHARTGMT
jgi:hypothetical protein